MFQQADVNEELMKFASFTNTCLLFCARNEETSSFITPESVKLAAKYF